jgi:hypothetical protein
MSNNILREEMQKMNGEIETKFTQLNKILDIVLQFNNHAIPEPDASKKQEQTSEIKAVKIPNKPEIEEDFDTPVFRSGSAQG